jgi:hypothetical protein
MEQAKYSEEDPQKLNILKCYYSSISERALDQVQGIILQLI